MKIHWQDTSEQTYLVWGCVYTAMEFVTIIITSSRQAAPLENKNFVRTSWDQGREWWTFHACGWSLAFSPSQIILLH